MHSTIRLGSHTECVARMEAIVFMEAHTQKHSG
jgi:hypothetical protein